MFTHLFVLTFVYKTWQEDLKWGERWTETTQGCRELGGEDDSVHMSLWLDLNLLPQPTQIIRFRIAWVWGTPWQPDSKHRLSLRMSLLCSRGWTCTTTEVSPHILYQWLITADTGTYACSHLRSSMYWQCCEMYYKINVCKASGFIYIVAKQNKLSKLN